MKYAFEMDQNRDFANKYESCKQKCRDEEFDKFYAKLIGITEDKNGKKKVPSPHR